MTTKIARMTRESEQRLLQVLEKVAAAIGDHDDPNEAIAKAASEHQVPAGHVHLLVNAYNTGRTTRQRQDGQDVWEKAATFPLADTKAVLQRMYPDRVKSAAELEQETAVSPDYLASPKAWVVRQQQAEKRAWAREQTLPPLTDKVWTPLRDERSEANRPYYHASKLEKIAQEAQRRANTAFDLANDAACALLDYFKEANALPFPEVKANCLRLHGDTVRPLFNFLEEENHKLTKQAMPRVPNPARGLPYELVDQCLETGVAFRALRQDYLAKQAAAEQAHDELLPKKAEVKQLHPILGTELEKTAGPFMNALGPMQSIAGNLSGEIWKERGKALAGSLIKKPSPDKALDAEMQTLRQKTLVQDLLSNDDAIGGHDPHDVLGAYREVADVAPIASQKPAIVKDFIRRRLAGGQLSYFDLEALSRIEKNLTNIQHGGSHGPDDR